MVRLHVDKAGRCPRPHRASRNLAYPIADQMHPGAGNVEAVQGDQAADGDRLGRSRRR